MHLLPRMNMMNVMQIVMSANFNLGDDNVILRRGGGNLIGTDDQFSAQARDRPYQNHNIYFFNCKFFFKIQYKKEEGVLKRFSMCY